MNIIKLKNKEEIIVSDATTDKIIAIIRENTNQKFILLPNRTLIAIDMIASISPILEEIKQYDDNVLDINIDEYTPDPL